MSDPAPVGLGSISERNEISTSCSDSDYVLQSESGSVDTEQLVTFMDSESPPDVGASASNHVFSTTDMTTDTGIEDFFKRPVRISSAVWLESAVAGTSLVSINPWNLWANSTYVKIKLNNYAWFRGDLKIKVQLTASPFYYGLLKATYQALPSFTPSTIAFDAGTRYLIPFSQRPTMDMDPVNGDSFTMTFPFIYPANWLSVQSAQAFSDLGQLNYFIYNQLRSANGVSSAGVNVVTYAWVENIQLSGASVGFAVQSDEYGEGCVSKPASWVASAATYFEKIPVIGPFATATRIGAGAVSAIASLFGFTNVPVITDTESVRPDTFPRLATSEIGYPIERLALDPKNELSIDPKIVGLPTGEDELSITSIATRDSYLTTASWLTSDSSDTVLFYSRVNPYLYDNDGATQAKLYLTPMAFAAGPFDNWRGDVIFRFQIIASKYHKGKIRISYDPSGYSAQNIGNTPANSNVVHTAIVDIGQTKDVEFRVPYQQATQFLTLRPDYSAANKGWAVRTTVPGTYPYSPLYDNGFLTLRVLNVLTAPEATSTVDINVYVRAADNIEFANPAAIDTTHRLSYFAPQSEEYSAVETTDHVVMASTNAMPNQQYLVHYGENIRSFRALLHRYELVTIDQVPEYAAADTLSYFYKYFYKMPPQPGYAPTAISTAGKIVGTGLAPYNYASLTLLSYLSPAFLCYRGATNWSFNVGADAPIRNLRVVKDNLSGLAAGTAVSNSSSTTQSRVASTINKRNSGLAGQALTNQLTQSGINVQCPMYTQFKFQSTNPANANQGVVLDGSILDFFILEGDYALAKSTTSNQTTIHSYVGTGHDFSLHYFLNVPTLYVYSAVPAPL